MTLAHLLRVLRLRVRSVSRPARLDEELSRELTFHFEALVGEKIAEGLSPAAARDAARRAIGNVAVFEEQCRDERRVAWIHDLRQDLAYAVRLLRKEPGFAAIAVLSLALGIGSNAAILGALDAVRLDTLSVHAADRLVFVRTVPRDRPGGPAFASIADYLAWQDRSRAFESIGASLADQRDLTTGDGGDGERLGGRLFTASMFDTLGVQPALGRAFTEADAPARGALVVLISDRLWRRRFDADPAVLGRQIRLNQATASIIGVMPPEFRLPDDRADYWLPFTANRGQKDGSNRFFIVTARLRPGITVAQAQADLDTIARDLASEFPDRYAGWDMRVQPVRDAMYGWTMGPLLTLGAAVALVLMISAANVAGLLLARGAVRRHEIALRRALGAGRARVVRQLLAESLLLAVLGGLTGLFVAWAGLRGLGALSPPPGSPQMTAIGLNGHVFLATALLSILTAVACGLGPAFAGSRNHLSAPLKEPAAGQGVRPGRSRSRGLLVASQIALALVLSIGAGLLMKSFVRLAGRDLNFDPSNLLTFDFRIPPGEYVRGLGAYRDLPYFEVSPAPSRTLERIHERLLAIPGVESAAGIAYAPVNSLVLPEFPVILEGQPAAAARDALNTKYFVVTPGWFATMRATIVQGRDFTAADTAGSQWTAVVNETAAQRFWPGQNPIGKRLTLDVVPDERPREVIAVIRDIPVRRRDIDPTPVAYASYLQQPARYRAPWGGMFGQMTFMVRHATSPLSLAPTVRQAVAEVDPRHPIFSILTMDQQLGMQVTGFRSYVLMMAAFALTATALAAVGIYGVMAFAVNQRRGEIGIRKALGASTQQVILLVGRSALPLIGAGLAAGLLGSLALTRALRSQLWGVTPTDPATIAAVSVLLAGVAVAACLVPTRRALAVDPTVALRSE